MADLNSVVKVVIRSKDDDRLFAAKRMTKSESISFSALWDFHHMESNYYIATEELETKKS